MPAFLPPKKILESNEAVGDAFLIEHPRAFIVMKHAGGTWNLEILLPDGTWLNIGAGGVQFTSGGLFHFYAVPAMNYRLRGGSVGAEAWLAYGEPAPG